VGLSLGVSQVSPGDKMAANLQDGNIIVLSNTRYLFQPLHIIISTITASYNRYLKTN
jgi:hypothetical protein